MRYALRSFIICLFAVALVVNGAASRILADGQTANAHHIAAKMAEAAHQGQHKTHHHDHAQADSKTVALGQLSMVDHIDGGAKCCTMCITLDNVMPTFTATTTQFHYRAVVFKAVRQHLSGHPVALDPDIPKIIV